jgi:antitoxin component YwqK of YwqJK toxin-antitoxin module
MRFFIFLLLLLISNSLPAQLTCQYRILSEIVTDEEIWYVEVVLGDGEKKKHRNRIISREQEGDTLKLVIAAKSDRIGPLFSAADMEADTLFLQFDVQPEKMDGYERVEVGEVVKLRTVELTVSGIQKDANIIYLNGEQIELSTEPYLVFPETFEIDQGDTINRKDRYGQKQGLWLEEYGHMKISESFYEDSELLHATWLEFYASGALKSESFFSTSTKVDLVSYRRYDRSGNVIEEELVINETGTFKRKWHSNGMKAQENLYDGQHIIISQFDEVGRLICTCKTEPGFTEPEGYDRYSSTETEKYNIPCTFYDEKGVVVDEKIKVFALSDLLPRN